MEDKDLHILQDARSQAISNHDIDLVKTGELGPRTLRVNKQWIADLLADGISFVWWLEKSVSKLF